MILRRHPHRGSLSSTDVFRRIIHRSRYGRVVALALFIAALTLTTLYSLGLSQTPTPEVAANNALGTSNSSIDLKPADLSKIIQREPTNYVDRVVEATSGGRVTGERETSDGVDVVLFAADLPLPRINGRNPGYTEPYSDRENPLALRLESGRWPERPGEVVLSRTADGLRTGESSIALPTSNTPVEVVGTFVRPADHDSVEIVGAPGTYRMFFTQDQDPDSRPDFSLELRSDQEGANAERLFATDLDKIRELTRSLDYGTDGEAALTFLSNPGELVGTSLHRSKFFKYPPSSTLDYDIWTFAVPAATTVFGICLMFFALPRSWLKTRRHQLSALGANGSRFGFVFAQVVSSRAALAISFGFLISILISFPLRMPLALKVDNDLSPWKLPLKPMVLVVASAASAILIGYLAFVSGALGRLMNALAARARSVDSNQAAKVASRSAAVFILLLFLTEFYLLRQEWSDARSIAQIIVIVALGVMIGGFATAKLFGAQVNGLSSLAFSQRIRRSNVLYRSLYVTLVCLLTALPVSYSALGATWFNNNNKNVQRILPQDAVMLGTFQGEKVPDSLRDKFESIVDLPEPTPIYSTAGPDLPDVAAPAKEAQIPGTIFEVDDVGEAEVFLENPLSLEESEHLLGGGVLVNSSTAGAQASKVRFDLLRFGMPPTQMNPNEPVPEPAVSSTDMAARSADFKEGWSYSVGAIMLRSAAEAHGFPASHPQFIYSNLDEKTLEAARNAANEMVGGSSLINLSEDPQPWLNPMILIFVSVTLLVILLIVCLVVSRSIDRQLDSVAEQLRTLGVSSRWFQRVKLHLVLAPLVFGGLFGVVTGLAPAWILSARYFGLEFFGIDTRVIVCCAAILAACGGLTLARTRLGRGS